MACLLLDYAFLSLVQPFSTNLNLKRRATVVTEWETFERQHAYYFFGATDTSDG